MQDSDVDSTHLQEWDWPILSSHQNHSERGALLRPISYEMTAPFDAFASQDRHGKALSVNISSGGMLLLMDRAPSVEQVLKVYVPTPLMLAETPTLAEVRWTRKLPFALRGSYFVGLKFLF
jgi:hypothetical protein